MGLAYILKIVLNPLIMHTHTRRHVATPHHISWYVSAWYKNDFFSFKILNKFKNSKKNPKIP